MPEPVRHNESQGVIVEQAEKAGTDFDPPASAGGPPVASRVQNNLPCAAPLCVDDQVPFGPGIGAHPESDLRPAKRLVQRLLFGRCDDYQSTLGATGANQADARPERRPSRL